jgi:beta-fructofuranosidase
MTPNPFYKPGDGWAGDFIPLFWDGEYHLFYLKDYRDVAGHGEGTPWFHIGTRDFVHYTDYGLALPRGTAEEQDLYVFTGSALRAEGLFHIFYTGHNPYLRQRGQPEQGIMHAVSRDLVAWEKVPADTFFAPADRFEPHDWRDPFVFWNAEAGEYWLLAAARLRDGPPRRRGCTALCTSNDLRTWHVADPLYAPGLYFTHECPDLFRVGDWWYLLFSEFTDASVTRYRMARSLSGPWLTPAVDTFDGRAFYAAKSASDGERRYLFGWNPTRQGDTDSGAWQWGANLVVHELRQQIDGALTVSQPESVAAAYDIPAAMVFTPAFGECDVEGDGVLLSAYEHFAYVTAGELLAACRITARFTLSASVRSCGLMLRASEDHETGYYVRVEPDRQRLVFDAWPRSGDRPFQVETERPFSAIAGVPFEITVIIEDTICEIYCGGAVVLSTRLYDHAAGGWGFFADGGEVMVENVSCWTREG